MRLRITLILLLACIQLSFSQDIPSIEKKVFKDADGKIYWPLSLPVYMFVSPEPNAANALTLRNVKERSMQGLANPMKWTEPGVHYIMNQDTSATGQGQLVAFPIYVDAGSPTTTLNFTGGDNFTSGQTFYGGGVRARFNSSDDMSGVVSTYMSLRNAPFQEQYGEFSFTEEGEYNIQYFSVDRVGNREEVKSTTLMIDLTAPNTEYELSNIPLNESVLSPNSTIQLTSSDASSGVKSTNYYVNDRQPTSGNQVSLAGLPSGNHVLSYFGIDNVNNVEEVKKFSFYLDNQPPAVTSTLNGDSYQNGGITYISPSTTIELNGEDDRAGVRSISYQINGNSAQTYSSPFNLPSNQGAFNVQFNAIDNVDNESAFSSNDILGNLFLDNTAPAISHNIDIDEVVRADSTYITSRASITLEINDEQSGAAKISYEMDGGSAQDYEQSIRLSREGAHSISYTGFDNVNNSSEQRILAIVDDTAPVISWEMSSQAIGSQTLVGRSGALQIFSFGTNLNLIARDASVGTAIIYYSLNGGPEVQFGGVVNMQQRGVNSLRIRAVDQLGNERNSELIEFVIQ